MNNQPKLLAIIGGGAAGFFCAINAKKLDPSLKIIIIEKTNKLLSKVKVSGGGRCNVTHDSASISEMIKCYPRGGNFLKKCFHQFFTTDTVSWFLERGVKLKTEADGRMFPTTDSSQTIIDCFLKEINKTDTEIILSREVRTIAKQNEKIELTFADGNKITADYVCIASGGFAKPSQFDWITSLGHTIELPVPSLFTFNLKDTAITSLMGVVVQNTQVKIQGSKFIQNGPLLITHWGFSGPCILKLSAYAARFLAESNYDFKISVNWLNGTPEQTVAQQFQQFRFSLSAQKFINRNPFQLPQRFWEYLIQKCGINPDVRWADLPAKQQNQFIKNLCAEEFSVKGKTTFKEEFVTSGGVNTSEIDVSTMESKLIPNLYFAGEILNVDGITGGYNFQNAWTTSFIAAKDIAHKSS